MQKSKLRLILFHWCLMILSGFALEAQNVVRPNVAAPAATGMEVNSYTGNLYYQRQDLFIPARGIDLDFTFFYNSTQSDEDWGYGYGWSHTYNIQLLPKQDEPLINCGGEETATEYLVLLNNEGAEIRFKRSYESGGCVRTVNFQSPSGFFGNLEEVNEVGSEQFRLTMKDGMIYHFETAGTYKLTQIEDRNGNTISLDYTVAGTDTYHLSSVTGPAGREINLQWQNGHLSAIVDALEAETRTISYAYESGGNLSKMTDPMGGEVLYGYGESNLMTGMIDENGNSTAIVYQAGGAVETLASCLSRQKFNYNPEQGKSYVTDISGSGNLVTTYEFDADGRNITRRGNCCGANQTYGYDVDNNIALTTDGNGNGYSYEYDTQGNLTKTIDPLGNTIEMGYHTTFNLVTSYKDKRNNTTNYTYDERGNLLTLQRPLGVSETYTYDANGNQTSHTDGEGNVTRYTYNVNGYLEEIRQPYGYVTRYEYDNRGNQLIEINANGDSTQYEYDLLDRLLKITDAMGYVTEYEYDARGNKVLEINAIGDSTVYKYDGLDRLIELTNPLKLVTNYEYDNRDNLIKETDYRGNSTLYTYNQLNLVETQTDPLGYSIQYTYDPNGNRTTVTDENGNQTQYVYDPLNRLQEVVGPMGESTKFHYDSNNNIITLEDAKGNEITYEYDILNRRIAIVDALGFRTQFEFFKSNNIKKIIDANNNETAYSYDSLNRRILEVFPDLSTEELQYDGMGNLIARKDNIGNWTTYVYNEFNQLTKRNYPGVNDDNFKYNALGQLVHAFNENAEILFNYDAIGRIVLEKLNNKTVLFKYKDKASRRTIIYPSGVIINEFYDARNDLILIQEESDTVISFNYDARRRLIKRSYSNGTETYYSYNSKDWLLELEHNSDNLGHFRYSYDMMGNKVSEEKIYNPNRSEYYDYDSNYRLTGFKRGKMENGEILDPIHAVTYHYDALGNRELVAENGSDIIYNSNNLNQYQTINGYDQVLLSYDLNGNLTSMSNTIFQYDFENRLIQVSSNENTTSFFYDPLGRRIITKSNSKEYTYQYVDWTEIEKTSTDGDSQYFIVGTGPDDKLYSSKGGQQIYYYENGSQNIIALGDENGKKIEHYNYSPFGKLTIFDSNNENIDDSTVSNEWFYNGRNKIGDTDFYDFRSRVLASSLGRFNQRDILDYIDGPNFYDYVGGNPINFSDPFGTSWRCSWDISTGNYQCLDENNKITASGTSYSGGDRGKNPACINNSFCVNIKNNGPPPPNVTFNIGKTEERPNRNGTTYPFRPLTPTDSRSKDILKENNRDGFGLHPGSNNTKTRNEKRDCIASPKQCSSRGCPILDSDLIRKIPTGSTLKTWSSFDNLLTDFW